MRFQNVIKYVIVTYCYERMYVMHILGFLDNGVPGEFKYFTLAHFIPLIIMGIIIFLIIKYKDAIRNWKHESSLRLIFAFIMIIMDMSYYWLVINPNIPTSPVEHLPIRVCGWACIFGSYLLVSKSKTLFDINYFWVFAGSVNALITPAVITNAGPSHYRYYQFWIEHTSLFICMIYMIFVHKMRPTWRSYFKSFAALFILALIAIAVNKAIPGANYLYLEGVVEGDSILNILPSNFWLRFGIMFILANVLFVIAYLPFLIKDIKNNPELKQIIIANEEYSTSLN